MSPHGRASSLRALVIVLLAFVASVVSPTGVSAAACWCHPKFPGFPSACNDAWEVLQGGVLGFTPICAGAPPPSDCVAQALAPPACPDPWCQFSLVATGNICIFVESIFPPSFINIWPTIPADKVSLSRTLKHGINLLKDLQIRLAAAPEFGPQWRGIRALMAYVVANLTGVLAAMKDPVNPDYQHVPPLPALPPVVPLVAGGDLTAAQASALTASMIAQRALQQRLQHFALTVDVLAGALDAPGGSDPVWVRRHALALDRLAQRIGDLGAAELALRPALAAAWPAVSVPAACLTNAQIGLLSVEAVALGVDVLALNEWQLWVQDELCQPASGWPGIFTAALADEQATYAWVGALRPATTICHVGGICSTVTTMTSVPLPPVPGKIKQTVTITGVGPFNVATATGLTVQVSVMGGGVAWALPDLTLVAGTAKLTVAGVPPGAYVMTFTFPEQQEAKFQTATLVKAVVVQ